VNGVRPARPAFLLALALGACAEPPAPPPVARDVILIVIDTLRADHVGCYGYDLPTTPTLDALAARGVRVADVTAQSSWTGPSMVSMFTARHVAADFVRMPAVTTLAEQLRAAGWRTLACQDNILLAPDTGFDRGFDQWLMEPGKRAMLEAINAPDPRPLFAYFHFVGPHDPWEPTPGFDRFPPRPLPDEQRAALRAYLAERWPDRTPEARDADLDAAAAEMSRQIALYDGDVLETDARVDYLISALDRAGHLDEALVIVAADHGEGLWQHRVPQLALGLDPRLADDLLTAFKRTHNTLLYEELTRVPLILLGPGLPAGVVLHGPRENVDIAPTVLELLGLPPLPEAAGRSLLADIRAAAAGQPTAGRHVVVSHTDQFMAARDAAGRKLIQPHDPAGADRPQYFDLSRDAREARPLPLDAGLPPELDQALQDLRAQGLRPLAGEDAIDAATRGRLQALGYLGR